MKTNETAFYLAWSYIGLCISLQAGEPASSQTTTADQLNWLEMQQVRIQYDTNKDGVLDASEQAAWKRDRTLRLSGSARRFDLNGDGKLDESELAAAKAWLRERKAPSAPAVVTPRASTMERQRAIERYNRDLIQRHDKDGNGILDEQEKDALWADWRGQLREKKMRQSSTQSRSVPNETPAKP